MLDFKTLEIYCLGFEIVSGLSLLRSLPTVLKNFTSYHSLASSQEKLAIMILQAH